VRVDIFLCIADSVCNVDSWQQVSNQIRVPVDASIDHRDSYPLANTLPVRLHHLQRSKVPLVVAHAVNMWNMRYCYG
jgi:hypothetical protein